MPTHDSMPIVARSMPTSRSQADSVENTSMNGRPAEKPRNSIASTRGCLYARTRVAQPRHQGFLTRVRPAAAPALGRSQVVRHGERRVIGEALRLVDFGAAHAAAQPGAQHLVVDAPTDVLRPGLAAVRPPRVLVRLGVHFAERVDVASRRRTARRARRAPRAGSRSSSGSTASCAGRFPCARCSSRRRGCSRASCASGPAGTA